MRRERCRTYTPKASEIQREWHVIDADGLVLGRMATEVARVLRGKHKPTFAPHLDTGDHVVDHQRRQGRADVGQGRPRAGVPPQRLPGRHQVRTATRELLAKSPEDAVRRTIKGMLPKGPLGRQMLTKLKVYAGPEHPHAAQSPSTLDLSAAKAR